MVFQLKPIETANGFLWVSIEFHTKFLWFLFEIHHKTNFPTASAETHVKTNGFLRFLFEIDQETNQIPNL